MPSLLRADGHSNVPGNGPNHFVYEMALMGHSTRQVQQIDFPAPAQIHPAQALTQLIDLHVGIAYPVLGLFGHPLTPVKNILLEVRFHGQQIHTGKVIREVYRVRGKGENIAVLTALHHKAQRFLGIVEGGERKHINGANGKLLSILHFRCQIQQLFRHFQGPCGSLGQIHRNTGCNDLLHAMAVILMLMGYQDTI